MEIELGVPGQMLPPAGRAVELARRNEEQGFDAVWWVDHLMGWHPDSLWTEDVTPLAHSQPNPHLYFDPLLMMALVGQQTKRLRVGVVVTDVIRRPPMVLAQTMLTLDHITGGRAILGLGTGEHLNLRPYGLPLDAPVSRLAEGIDVMRLLWEAEGPVDYDGRFFHLKDAVLGLAPVGEHPPPIWTAAHGPRMLALTGRKADGWLPTKLEPEEYAACLDVIRGVATDAGRDPHDVTPAMLAYVIVAPDEATVEELLSRPLVRALCVMLSSETFRRLGLTPPLEGVGSGFHGFVPTRVDRAEAERIIEAIPPRVVRHYAFCGTPDQIADQIREYRELRHLVLWNITAFAEPSLAGVSFRCLTELKQALQGAAS